jgi:Ni,Fe-hydrogenase III small subunit/NAD-dependent dihydropyrimidine dehydrogenase PreA subunit
MFKLILDALTAAGSGRNAARSAPPPHLRGKVEIDFSRCTLSGACAAACPTPALQLDHDPAARRATLTLDLGHCVFCGLCEEACEEGAVRLGDVFALATPRRADLVTRGVFQIGPGAPAREEPLAAANGTPRTGGDGARLRRRILDRFGRSLHVRHLDVGSCSGCETEIQAALGPVHDLTRWGIEFVLSPRHADLLLVTGVVTAGTEALLGEAHAAMPDPKLVVALGACAIDGGIHQGGYATLGGAARTLPVDVFVPGCPPRPQAVAHGILLALDRAESGVRATTWRGPYPEPATRTTP